MRKRTISNLCDNIMWYLIYLIPIFPMLILIFKTGSAITLSSAMSSIGFDVLTTTPVYTALDSIFGSAGTLPIFVSPDVLLYMSYFVCVFLIHLAVDFLLFIPRICHKWMTKLYGGEND